MSAAIAVASTLKRLLPSSSEPISPSLFAKSRCAVLAPRLPLPASWWIRAGEAPDGSVYQDGFGKSRKWSPEEMEGQGQWTWYNPASWFGYGKIQEVHVNTGVNTGAGAA